MEKFRCDNCSSADFIFLHPGRDRLHELEGEFSVVKCKECGLIAIHPKLSQEKVSSYYPSDYISYPIAADDERTWLKKLDRKRGINRRCKIIIDRTSKPGRILDVGCATGNFLNGMQQHGWQCFGIEPNEYAADYAKNRFDLQIINGYLTKNLFPNDYFDVVTLWDVFEHLPEPKKDLSLIWNILKPGGLLVITTPNADAWGRRIFAENWVGWDVPRHYHIFSPGTIKDMLNKSSFQIQEIMSFTGRHGAFILSVEFFLRGKDIPLWSKRLILSLVKSFPCRVIAHPFYILAEKANHSSTMTVFAKKMS